MNVVVGSANALKVQAVHSALERFGVVIGSIEGLNFPSAVRDQPVGIDETRRGAEYRAEESMRQRPDADLWVAMENGVVHKDEWANIAGFNQYWITESHEGEWTDIAAIAILRSENSSSLSELPLVIQGWSQGIEVPTKDIENAKDESGQIVRNWSPLKDPHLILTNNTKPRSEFLSEAIFSTLQNPL